MQGGGSNRDGSADSGDSAMPAAPAAIAAFGRQNPFEVGGDGEALAGGASMSERRPAAADLAPAIRIGRYGVLRELGRGGMGVTYVAYDEELDRKVALKLVRAEVLGEESQKRLRREAQALARLAHPNIVAVHDVGMHGGQAFIAMEFVRGQTVSGWLATPLPRAWAEIVSVFCQAGEGLRAAHAAGLVHRDIKPANIIVGDDGRVRVLDFGLARQALSGDEGDGADGVIAVDMDEPLTYTGALVGTLGYMAPEQLDGSVADARSDQFAFCVSLFEALYGCQPFSGTRPRVRLAAMRRGKLADVTGKHAVPRWLHAVIVRGLALRPDARWPSMDALLAELRRDPAGIRRQRVAMSAVGAGLALLGAALVVGVSVDHARQAAVCSGARAQIDEVWSAEQRAAIQRAMLASGVAYARDTWQRTSAVLDRYAADWAAAHTDACEATAVRQEQSEEVLDQRMQCLARRRRSLRVLVGELGRIDPASMERAIDAAGRLPLIASCSDAAYLGSRIEPPRDPVVAGQVDEVEAALTRAEQLQDLGRYDEGLAEAQRAFERATQVGYPPIEAQARLRLGTLQLAAAAYQPAEDSLEEAYFIARAVGDHEVALQATTQLAYLLGVYVSRLDDAVGWSRHVHAELSWVSSAVERASSLNTLGVLAMLQGKHEEAAEQFRQALEIWEQALGPGHPRVADALDNLGVVLHMQGKYEEASEQHRRALAVSEQALGAMHPFVAYSLNNLGAALYRQGKHAEAAVPYDRALTIREQTLGADHPLVADPLIGLALTYLDGGDAARALPLARRAIAVLERHAVGPERLVEARFVVARALMATNEDPHQALALARQVRDVLQAAPVPLSLIDLADVEAWLRDYDLEHGPEHESEHGPEHGRSRRERERP